MSRAMIIIVGQTPPPYHGQAIMIERLVTGLAGRLPMTHVPMRFSSTIDEVGRFAPRKLLHLLALTGRVRALLRRFPGAVLYYPPAGPGAVPILRDLFFLTIVRRYAGSVVFHFEAGGVAGYLRQHPFLRRLCRRCYARPHAAIVLSEACRDDAEYFQARRIVVVPNGIPDPAVAPAARPPGVALRILYVGALRVEKGILDALAVLRELRERGVACQLVLVGAWGSSLDRAAFAEGVREGQLQGMIVEAGERTGGAKWELYADSHVFFFPSFYAAEGLSVAVIESMAAGMPAVVSRWRGQIDLVADGESGYIVPPHDVRGYADRLERLAGDESLRRAMGRAARTRFEARYTERHYVDGVAAVFEEVGRMRGRSDAA